MAASKGMDPLPVILVSALEAEHLGIAVNDKEFAQNDLFSDYESKGK